MNVIVEQSHVYDLDILDCETWSYVLWETKGDEVLLTPLLPRTKRHRISLVSKHTSKALIKLLRDRDTKIVFINSFIEIPLILSKFDTEPVSYKCLTVMASSLGYSSYEAYCNTLDDVEFESYDRAASIYEKYNRLWERLKAEVPIGKLRDNMIKAFTIACLLQSNPQLIMLASTELDKFKQVHLVEG